MSVFIIESSYPRDYYLNQLDGVVTQSVLRVLRVKFEMRMVLDAAHFNKALRRAKAISLKVIHLSCHGDEYGIRLADNNPVNWPEFAECFQRADYCPPALVMSSCCGAATGIGKAFAPHRKKPEIIFGSVDERSYGEYATAWTILYHRFALDGVNKRSAQKALSHINAVVSQKFRYRRWEASVNRYVSFPPKRTYYAVTAIKA